MPPVQGAQSTGSVFVQVLLFRRPQPATQSSRIPRPPCSPSPAVPRTNQCRWITLGFLKQLLRLRPICPEAGAVPSLGQTPKFALLVSHPNNVPQTYRTTRPSIHGCWHVLHVSPYHSIVVRCAKTTYHRSSMATLRNFTLHLNLHLL